MRTKFGTPTILAKSTPWRMCKNLLYKCVLIVVTTIYYSFFPTHHCSNADYIWTHSTMFKIVHGLFYFPSGVFVEQAPRVTRSQSHQVFVCPYAHTSSFYNSFVPRTICNWNMFTAHVLLSFSSSVSSFKTNFWAYMQN